MVGRDTEVAAPTSTRQTLQEIRSLREVAESLEGAVNGLASREYVEEIQREEDRKRKRFGLVVVASGACFLLMFILLTVGLYQINEIAQTNRENTNLLVECNAPSAPGDPHECFEREQAGIGKAIDEVVRKISEQMDRQHRLLQQ